MFAVETEIPLGITNQFNIQSEASSLRRNNAIETTMDNILHLFAEFACKVSLVNYHYIQTKDNCLLFPGLEKEGDIANMYSRGVRPESRRSVLEYHGFLGLKEKIINAKNPSFAVWVSPPGPKNEGYGDYGFFYIGCIPKYKEGKDRKIQMFAFRVNEFEARLVSQSIQLLKLFNPDGWIPSSEQADKLLLNPIVLPWGQEYSVGKETYAIKNPQDLLSLIIAFLGVKTNEQEIRDGLSGKILNAVHKRFRSKIYKIFNKVWSIAKGIPVKINKRDLFEEFQNFSGGSCPGKSSSPELSQEDDKDKEEVHWCPSCGEFFKGNKCSCGYILGSK